MGKHDYTIHVGTWEKPTDGRKGLEKTLTRKQEGKQDVSTKVYFDLEEVVRNQGTVKDLCRNYDLVALDRILSIIPEEVIPIEEDTIN